MMESWGISTLPFVISGPLAAVIMHFLAGGRLPEHPVIAIPPFCVGLIIGKVWFVLERIGWDQIFFWICVVAGAVLVIGVIVCGVWFGWPLVDYFRYSPAKIHRSPISQSFQVPPNLRFSGTQRSQAPNYVHQANVQPSVLLHGCKSLAVAQDIIFNDRWLIGTSMPSAVWLTTSWSYASTNAGDNGCILKVNVSAGIQLEKKSANTFIAPIPNAEINSQYYRIPGVRAVEAYSTNRQRLI